MRVKRSSRSNSQESTPSAFEPGEPSEQSDRPKRSNPRKLLEDLITTENVDSMVRYVGLAFSSLDASLPEPSDREDEERRKAVYEEAAVLLRCASMTYLRERDPAAFKTILYSVVRWAEQTTKSRDRVDFRIVRPRFVDSFGGTLLLISALSVYAKLKDDLTEAWHRAAKSTPAPFTHSHSVSRKGRYGQTQKEGAARRRMVIDARAEAVLGKAIELLDREVLAARPLSKDQVVRWVRVEKTPAAILHRLLGYLLRLDPRTIKLMLNRARKRNREALEHQALLERKGWSRLG